MRIYDVITKISNITMIAAGVKNVFYIFDQSIEIVLKTKNGRNDILAWNKFLIKAESGDKNVFLWTEKSPHNFSIMDQYHGLKKKKYLKNLLNFFLKINQFEKYGQNSLLLTHPLQFEDFFHSNVTQKISLMYVKRKSNNYPQQNKKNDLLRNVVKHQTSSS